MDATDHRHSPAVWAMTHAALLVLGYAGLIGGNTVAGVIYLTIIWCVIIKNSLAIASSAMFNSLPEFLRDIPIGPRTLKELATSWLLLNSGHPYAATFVSLIMATQIMSAIKDAQQGTNNAAPHSKKQ